MNPFRIGREMPVRINLATAFGNRLNAEGAVLPPEFELGGSNLANAIEEAERAPIPPGVVTGSNVVSGEIDLAKRFSAEVDGPLSVPSGGTGLSGIPDGSLLVGSGTGPIRPTSLSRWDSPPVPASSNAPNPGLVIGGVRLGEYTMVAEPSAFDGVTLTATGTTGTYDIVRPGNSRPGMDFQIEVVHPSSVRATISVLQGHPVQALVGLSIVDDSFSEYTSAYLRERPTRTVWFRDESLVVTFRDLEQGKHYVIAAALRDSRGRMSQTSNLEFSL